MSAHGIADCGRTESSNKGLSVTRFCFLRLTTALLTMCRALSA